MNADREPDIFLFNFEKIHSILLSKDQCTHILILHDDVNKYS